MILAALGAAAVLAAAQPPPEPTAKAPIVVDGKPISRGYLRHWMEIAEATGLARRHVRSATVQLLISSRWIRTEAAERGVEVNRGEVTRALRRQRRAAFRSRRAFRAFLRNSGQSVRDLRSRVQIDLLITRIRRQVTDGAATVEEQQRQLDEFVREFQRKWRARTACRAPWVTPDCGSRIRRAR